MGLPSWLRSIWTSKTACITSDSDICKCLSFISKFSIYFLHFYPLFVVIFNYILLILLSFFFFSVNLCGILDHFGYKVPDFSFIHESIWYDLGRFENWLIDRRGLNLGDVVPFRSRRLPGPNSPVSDGSQTSVSEGEEPFISASSTTSKAASLPENLNGSRWEPSSSKATAGDDQAISSIEKLDGIGSFLAPLSEESMEKADILLRAREEASRFTADPCSIQSWLEKSTLDSSSLSIEICHPLATPPHTVLHEETDSLVLKEKPLAREIKEEPMSPDGVQPTPASISSAET